MRTVDDLEAFAIKLHQRERARQGLQLTLEVNFSGLTLRTVSPSHPDRRRAGTIPFRELREMAIEALEPWVDREIAAADQRL